MNFELDEMQTMLKDSIARFLEKEYDFDGRRKLVHEQGGFSEANWNIFAEMGWLGASLPEELGGLGGSAIEAAILMEEFGHAMVVEPFLAIGILAAQTLIGAGGDTAHALVRSIAAGERRIVLAHGEAAARGRIAHVGTAATATNDGYLLNGAKTLVIGAPFADSFIVSARTSGANADQDGISLFLVPIDTPGLNVHAFRLANGMRAAELTFSNVTVSSAAMIGAIGGGFAALDRGLAHATLAACSEALGAMDRALWLTRDYVQTRKQFGQTIGSFQSIQHRMADMLIEVELSRSVIFRALAHIDAEPKIRAHAVSIAKVQIGKSAKFVGGQAIQLHGGIGVTEEYIIGHYFKHLTFLDNLFGTVELHLQNIAKAA